MTMRLSELLSHLNDLADQLPAGADPEVRLVHQPSYPLIVSLDNDNAPALVDGTIYIAESVWGGNDYATEEIADAVGYGH